MKDLEQNDNRKIRRKCVIENLIFTFGRKKLNGDGGGGCSGNSGGGGCDDDIGMCMSWCRPNERAYQILRSFTLSSTL